MVDKMLEMNNVYQGDCLPLMRKFPDKYFDLVVTDPPYGEGFETMKKISVNNCAKCGDYQYGEWNNKTPSKEYFNELFRISKNQIIFGGNYFELPQSPCWLIWDKDNTGYFADAELIWTSFKSSVRLFKWRWNGMLQEDPAHKEERVHPTQKPLPLMKWLLEKYSNPYQLILDPFMGSGTTCVAAKELHRNYIGIDMEPKYVEIAKDRLAKAKVYSKDTQNFLSEF